MAGAHHMANAGHQLAVADDLVIIVVYLARIGDGQVEVDADPLAGDALMLMQADLGAEHQIADLDPHALSLRGGPMGELGDGTWLGHGRLSSRAYSRATKPRAD